MEILMKINLNFLQRLGKSIMFPVTVLPIAALMQRLGAPDVFNIPVITQSGGIIFSNLALLFAIGVAVGWAFDGSGSAGLAGAVTYLVITTSTEVVFTSMNPDIQAVGLKNNVFFGIIAGLLAGSIYNRYYNIKMPEFLGFFGGRRFVPMCSGIISIFVGIFMGNIWNLLQAGLQSFSSSVTESGPIGPFLFGLLNRGLWPIGLHHVFNNIVWFIFGNYTDTLGNIITGDIGRYFAGDPTAGIFTAGFYPIFLGGYTGATLAMYLLAKPEKRKVTGGLLLSTWLAAFITGIDEPLVFLILFSAPVFYLIHVVLTGVSMYVATVLGAKISFGFSAGALDFILAYGLSTNAHILLIMSIIYFIVYFLIFTGYIKYFNIQTPGREEEDEESTTLPSTISSLEDKSNYILQAIGGKENLTSVTNCITRLRLGIKDTSKINKDALNKERFKYILLNQDGIQVILGLEAELIANIWKNQVK